MEGPDDLAVFERVEFRAALDYAVGERRHALYVLKHPAVDGAVLARRGREDRWGLSANDRLTSLVWTTSAEDDLVAMIRTATGVADLDVAIERVSSFTFAAQIARRYRSGRSFLVGDAAHRMTPRGGTGMNTGIQDAFDVGWKLAWVLHGWAPEHLLDTYERERRPIGLHNVGRAGEAGGAQRTTNEALPWDLDDRLAHYWLDNDARRVSTLDRIGDGLTIFAAVVDPCWVDVVGQIGFTAPLDEVVVDAGAAAGAGARTNSRPSLSDRTATKWPAGRLPPANPSTVWLGCEAG